MLLCVKQHSCCPSKSQKSFEKLATPEVNAIQISHYVSSNGLDVVILDRSLVYSSKSNYNKIEPMEKTPGTDHCVFWQHE